jgi:spermidine/putrescine-binding protein
MNPNAGSGLVRMRTFGTVSRRGFIAGSGALMGTALSGGFDTAEAATNVTFVGWQGYDTPFADYAKAHDIVIDATYIGDSQQIISKLTSGGIGSVDLVTPNVIWTPLMVKLGLLTPIDEAKLPNLSKVLPYFIGNPSARIDGKLYAVPYCWGAVPMMYDPAVIPVAPESWKDLLKPEYTGKVAMLDNLQDITLAARIVTDAPVPTRLTKEQLAQAVDFLIAVKKQSRIIGANYGEMADAMARGEVVITYNGWEVMVNMAQKKGKKIAYTYPKEGSFGWVDSFCIAKDAPHMDVAHQLCNEAISEPIQLLAGEKELLGVVNTDAIAKLPAETRAMYPYDNIDEFAKRVGFFPAVPLEREGDFTNLDDWKAEYLRFKNA